MKKASPTEKTLLLLSRTQLPQCRIQLAGSGSGTTAHISFPGSGGMIPVELLVSAYTGIARLWPVIAPIREQVRQNKILAYQAEQARIRAAKLAQPKKRRIKPQVVLEPVQMDGVTKYLRRETAPGVVLERKSS